MVTSKTGTTSPIGVTADYKPLADSLLKSGVIPIMVLHAEYHKFISDSTTLSSLITFQNNQLNDVAGRTSSPYELHEIVSFSPKQNKFYDKLSHDFRINADFIRTNVSKTVSTIQIDFDNGSGYQTMTLGSNSKITWSTFGKKVLRLKITYSDSSVYHAKAQINLVDKSGGQPKYNSAWDDSVYIPHPTIANHGVGLAIEYGCGNNELRKPFIYVEGFNPDLFGDQFYEEDFFEDFDDYEFQWDEGFPLLSELDENGYDVVYVDFDRGDGSLIENAKALQAAINWINEEKAANCSSSDNILVGYSMGGVVARLALTYMEDDAEDHEVSYYVSVDSPHRGANIPRAIIAALIDVRNYHFDGFNVSEDVPRVEDAYQVLFSPAAKQMLLYSGEGSNEMVTGHGPTYTSFQNHLHNDQGMPTETLQNIAVAKGGGTGVGQFGSMLPILDINTSTFSALGCFTDVPDVVGWFAGAFALLKLGLYAKVVIDINAMPGHIASPLEIYERKIRVIATAPIIPIPYFYWDRHNTDAKTVNFYDGVQGGTYGLGNYADLDNEFISEVIEGDYEPCLSLDQTGFAFIPTVSALDMGDFIGGTGPVSPNVQIDPLVITTNGQTSFEKAFILDPTKYPSGFVAPTNESHLELTPSNIFPFSTFIPAAFNTINNGSAVLGLTYNFGAGIQSGEMVKTSDRLTTLIDVEEISGIEGTVCINCDDRIDITALPTNPDNIAEYFSLELTEACDGDHGRLRINNGGNLFIGENQNQKANVIVRDNSWIELNDGQIEVREGSKLIIDNGAELRLKSGSIKVFDGGEILIKEGGLLIFEDNVNLELNGNDAQLVLEGLTYVGDNATFGFSYTGTESGYIRIAKDGHWGERFAAGVNAEVLLEGVNENDLILQIEEGADFWEFEGSVPNQSFTSNRFERVQFRDGQVYFEDDARMVLRAKSKFYNCTISQAGYPALVRGIVNFRKLEIINTDVMSVDIESALHYYNEGALIGVNSNFNYSDVYVRGFGYYFRDCVMDHTSLMADQSTIGNKIIRSTFQYSSTVADFSTTELTVSNSTFTNNDHALYRRFGRATIKCSSFTNNSTAIEGTLGSIINMSTLYNGGYNYFDDNDYNIEI